MEDQRLEANLHNFHFGAGETNIETAEEQLGDLSVLIEQSLTPLAVGDIINSMNQNNMQHQQHDLQQNIQALNPLTYQFLAAGNMPVIILNLPQQNSVISPPTPSAEMSHMSLAENIPLRQIEPPYKKRKSVVEENDYDLAALSHQMDQLRRNSLPVLHSIHIPSRETITPSLSVDELLSPSRVIRDDIDLLEEYENDIISGLGEEKENESPSRSFDFGDFFTSPPPPKECMPQQEQNATESPLNQQPLTIDTEAAKTTEKKTKRRKSTPGGETPGEGRTLVCLGKRPRKNKKSQPEDQFLLKFTMRRSK